MRHREANAEFTEDAILLQPSANVGLPSPRLGGCRARDPQRRKALAHRDRRRPRRPGRALARTSRAEDIEGGTFTISNLACTRWNASPRCSTLQAARRRGRDRDRRPVRRRPPCGRCRHRHVRPPRSRRRSRRRLPPDAEGEPRGSGARLVGAWPRPSGTTSATSTRAAASTGSCSASRSWRWTSRRAGRI